MADSKISQLASGAPAVLADVVPIYDVSAVATHSLTLQQIFDTAGLLASASPAALTDLLAAVRASTGKSLSVQDVLTAGGLATSGAPAQLTDALAVIRSGALKSLTINDILTLGSSAQPIINGGMRVAQRATSQNLTNSMVFGSLDRWAGAMSGTAAGVLQQQAQSMPGTNTSHRLRLARNSGSTSTGTLFTSYIFESVDVIALQGKTITISWDSASGAQFSAASGNYTVKAFYGTGTDQGAASYFAATWTGQAQVTGSPFTKTATAGANSVRNSITITVPASATELALEFSWVPVGTAGVDDALYLCQVKYDIGSAASSPVLPPIVDDYERCQRYLPCFQAVNGVGGDTGGFGQAISTTQAILGFEFKVRTRASITSIAVTNPTSVYTRDASGNPIALSSLAFRIGGLYSCEMTATVASGLVAGSASKWGANNASLAQILFNGAELV